LLGCGTVGGGVYQALSQLPELFSIVGVGTRTPERATQLGIPADLVTTDLETLVEQPSDVVVELIGGTSRAASLVERALSAGRHVVTANKCLIALVGDRLRAQAAAKGVDLRYGAAVGGVMPAIETIQRVRNSGSLKSFSGVLNATANFVLDEIVAGRSLDAAVRTAQERGYAEANPHVDLDGSDAAHKLAILASAAFDVSFPLHRVECHGISDLGADELRSAYRRGKTIRLVAACRRVADQIEASVGPLELSLDHPLAQVSGTQNRLLVEPEAGEPVIVSGEGAGRWPTTEAVIADLLDLRIN
jgi:homoserine dehydrogenase